MRNPFGLEHFDSNRQRLSEYISRHKGDHELVGVFDIGTKSTRLLVGFKDVPETAKSWNPEVFFNDGQVFNLGRDFNPYESILDIKKSRELKGVIYFIKTYTQMLERAGLRKENMIAVGTAIFRWMQNKDEVIEEIYSQTGVRVIPLQPLYEGFLSLIAIAHTYDFTANQNSLRKEFTEDDVILLFDQGGGSTEISYFFPKKLSIGNLDSIDELGTVALQDNFFRLDVVKKIDPQESRRKISKQFERINEFVDSKVANWNGFPELLDDNKIRLHAFGMGSAILKCFPSQGGHNLHNSLLTIENMRNILEEYCAALDSSSQQVRTLYNLIKQEEREGRKNISNRLVLIYGLPVYEKLLRRFNLTQLRYAAYGLRYGVYIAKYKWSLDLHHLPQALPPNQKPNHPKPTEENTMESIITDIFDKQIQVSKTHLDECIHLLELNYKDLREGSAVQKEKAEKEIPGLKKEIAKIEGELIFFVIKGISETQLKGISETQQEELKQSLITSRDPKAFPQVKEIAKNKAKRLLEEYGPKVVESGVKAIFDAILKSMGG